MKRNKTKRVCVLDICSLNCPQNPQIIWIFAPPPSPWPYSMLRGIMESIFIVSSETIPLRSIDSSYYTRWTDWLLLQHRIFENKFDVQRKHHFLNHSNRIKKEKVIKSKIIMFKKRSLKGIVLSSWKYVLSWTVDTKCKG